MGNFNVSLVQLGGRAQPTALLYVTFLIHRKNSPTSPTSADSEGSSLQRSRSSSILSNQPYSTSLLIFV
jgi:hypothetical protein